MPSSDTAEGSPGDLWAGYRAAHCPDCPHAPPEPPGGPDLFQVTGYEILHRIVRAGGSSGRANLPKTWIDEDVIVIRKTRNQKEHPPDEGEPGNP